MNFYDTCSLLNGYAEIFRNIHSEPFVISNLTLKEIEEIKTSRFKDEEIKYRAKRLSNLLNIYDNNYTIVNYNKDWDLSYLNPNPILLDNNDSRIIITAWVYSETHPDMIFVTADLSCNNIARSIGIATNFITKKEDNT